MKKLAPQHSPSPPPPLRPAVQWFAGHMERELRQNDHKGHWSNCGLDYLVRRLRQEYEELRGALHERYDGSFANDYGGPAEADRRAKASSRVTSEAADVANFALMIADVVHNELTDLSPYRSLEHENGRGPWMFTASGRVFYPFDPQPEEIHLFDIAHPLAMIPRYGGHIIRPYSVAEHSGFVADEMRLHGELLGDVRAGQLHDAAESKIGDMIGPIKRRLPEYKFIEYKIERAIAQRFNLPFPFPPSVKRADLAMQVVEKRVLRVKPLPGVVLPPEQDTIVEPCDHTPVPLKTTPGTFEQIRDEFLTRCEDLGIR